MTSAREAKPVEAKRADPAADVSAWEREIDHHVCRARQRRLVGLGYRLYGLTAAEIKLVESASTEATARRGRVGGKAEG